MPDTHSASSFVSREVEASRLFFLDPAADPNFAVVFGGFERCAPDYRIDRRDFPWYSLEFVSHGSGTLQLDGVEWDLVPGSFFIYGPSSPQQMRSSVENPLGKYFVGFSGTGAGDFLERHGMGEGYVSRCLKSEPIRRSFDTLIERGTRKSRLAGPLCAAITRQLLLMCRDDATDPGNTDSAAFASYTRVREFIEREFPTTTRLEAVAKSCGIDAPYLCRLFARFHDESAYRYLTRLRMEQASRMLLEGDASVRSVAAALGFKDAFHFSRVFKSVHQVPPSRFRLMRLGFDG
ncbi:MAG: AraC family transcriptional regulator [Akkermansiaceae bacterium]